MQYLALYFFSLLISLVTIVRVAAGFLIIIIESKVWLISHCSELGRETMVCAVCLAMFFWTVCYMEPFEQGHYYCGSGDYVTNKVWLLLRYE